MDWGVQGYGGRQEQGTEANPSRGPGAGPDGPGVEESRVPHGLPKDNKEKQILWLLAHGPASSLRIGCQSSLDRK